jgi:hypothetical protein
MSIWISRRRLLGAVAIVATPAFAQKPAADPLDVKVIVPKPDYSSPFSRYRRDADAEVGGWRELNRNVNRIGGWRTYAREAAEPPAPPASAPQR